MAKYFIYFGGIILFVVLGLWFELTSGDYLIIEKATHSPPKVSSNK